MKRLYLLTVTLAALAAVLPAAAARADGKPVRPISERFSMADAAETPHFQKHVIPLMGKLGCNGRACHGSFQGQGGFRLSLFGYDFDSDHAALTQGDEPRVDLEFPDESLIIEKAAQEIPHRGGKRMDVGSWEYNVFLKWVAAGAKGLEKRDDDLTFARLEVTPQEIVFGKAGETVELRAVAVWSDGSREDVTPLCRFQTNDEQVAEVDGQRAMVTAANDPGDTHVVVFYDKAVVPVPVLRSVTDKVGPKYPQVPTPTPIDDLVVQKLRKLGVVQSDVCTDEEFLRRVSLDMTGTLPSPQEVQEFVSDTSPDKRTDKIDELLERPAYAAWWATKFCDFTGNNDRYLNNVGIRGKAVQEWYEWIEARIAENVPYDELTSRIVLAVSRNPDESFREYSESMSRLYHKNPEGSFSDREFMPYYWARTNFRNAENRVMGFAYSFMGIRIECAQCHKHPFDEWSQQDFNDFMGFFTRVNYGDNPDARDESTKMAKALGLADLRGNLLRRELPGLLNKGKVIPFSEVYVVPGRGGRNIRGGQAAQTARLLGGERIDLSKQDDPRQPLMDWLRSPDNRFFASAFVNRVWAGYFNVGIVDPPDDLSLANPPSNKPLLDYLSRAFIDSGFDMKWLHREISNSRTYQLSWKPNETNLHDEKNFSRAVLRRLPAEVAYDAIQQATASDETTAKLQTEMAGRAISMPAFSSRTSAQGQGYALTIFGKSIRENNCDCERSAEPSLLQTVYLRNDSELHTLLGRRDGWLADLTRQLQKDAEWDAGDVVRQAYLRTLSRYPTDEELERAGRFLLEAESPVEGARGLLWALLNTKEFIINH